MTVDMRLFKKRANVIMIIGYIAFDIIIIGALAADMFRFHIFTVVNLIAVVFYPLASYHQMKKIESGVITVKKDKRLYKWNLVFLIIFFFLSYFVLSLSLVLKSDTLFPSISMNLTLVEFSSIVRILKENQDV